MPISEKLHQIQAQRAKHKDALEKQEENFKQIKNFAFQLEQLSQNPYWLAMVSVDPSRNLAWQKLMSYIKDNDFFNKVRTLFGSNATTFERGGALKTIYDRVSREFITISVMGPIAAGKSLFLQLITGLDDNSIPVSANICTAACTTFINDPRKSATISFLSEIEIIELVADHLELLNAHLRNTHKDSEIKFLITKPNAIKLSLRNLLEQIRNCGYLNDHLYSEHTIALNEEASLGSSLGYYKTLKGYCDQYNFYSQYIGHPDLPVNESEITSGELKKFVSYSDDGSTSAFAVRKVSIYWPLNLNGENLGEIRLQDTMGIGEAKIGVTENLAKNLRDESDIAIALCSVKQDQTLDTDVNSRTFLQVLKDSVEGRCPEQWIFYLLNKYASATADDVIRVKEQLSTAMSQGSVQINLPNCNFSEVEFMLSDGNKNYVGIADYFSSCIIPNIVKNIDSIDKFFIASAEVCLTEVCVAYDYLTKSFASFPIPQCHPEDNVITVLNDVQSAYFKLLDLRASYNEKIHQELVTYFENQPLGNLVYRFLGDDNTLDYSKSDTPPHKLVSEIAEKNILPKLKNVYTPNHFYSGYAFSFLYEISRDFEDFLTADLTCFLSTVDIINQISDIKAKIGEIFMTEGRLAFNNVAAKDWLNAFVLELKSKETDYPNLINCLESFVQQDVDLKQLVIGTVCYVVHRICSCYYNFGLVNEGDNFVIDNYDDWMSATAVCLVHKEKRLEDIVRDEYCEHIGEEIRLAQEKFIASTNAFMIGRQGLIPKDTTKSLVPPVMRELIGYYLENYSTIFGDGDDYTKKIEAINEAKVIRKTFCK